MRVRAHLVFSVLTAFLALAPLTVLAQQDSTEIKLRDLGPSARGQIAIISPDGQCRGKLSGFQSPSGIFLMPDGRRLVYDAATNEVHTIVPGNPTAIGGGNSFTLGRTWSVPAQADGLIVSYSTAPDSLLLVDRRGRAFQLSQETIVATSQPPAEEVAISSAAVLSDGRIIAVRAGATNLADGLFVLRTDSWAWSRVNVDSKAASDIPAPTGVATVGDTVYLWRGGNEVIAYGTQSGDSLAISGRLNYPGVAMVVPTASQGIYIITLSGKVARFSNAFKPLSEYQFVNLPTGSVASPTDDSLWLLHEYPISREWPQWRNSILHHQPRPFNWKVFLPIFWGAVALTTIWALIAVRWGCESPPVDRRVAHKAIRTPRDWKVAVVLCTLCGIAGGGLYLCWGAQGRLLAGLGKQAWLASYLAGAIAVAVATEAWRRWRPEVDDARPFAEVIREPAPKPGIAFLAPLIAIAVLSVMLYSLGIGHWYNNGYREALFCAGLVCVAGILLVDAWTCRRQLREWLRAEWLFILIPILVGVATLFYRLEDVPYNIHFDFTTHAFVAEQFIRGMINGWWDWGFVPAPVIGSIPEIVGFLIAGFSPFGYRFGSALFNLSAIFAVYLLGREYRNPRVGFWAAIILAGNTPFIHFGRLMSNGFAATLALWSVVTLTLALKYKRSSLWLLTGVVAAATFYQWPVARVGAVAAAVMFAVVYIRFPVRQLKQLPQHIYGVAGVALLLAPLLIMWMTYPERLMPRAQESLTGLTISAASGKVRVEESTLELFFRSLGWVFNEYDRSSQGSISPGFNSLEAVLFACGLAVILIEGFGVNILLGVMLVITLLVCGAWAVGPPWYTRLLPSAPIVCVVIARAMEGLHNFFRFANRSVFWAIFVLISTALLYVSPWCNFKRYYDYETAVVRRNNLYPQVAIGHAIHDTGPRYTYTLLLAGEPTWRFSESPIGHLLPYISERRLKECYDVRDELPVKPDEPKAFILQVKRLDLDLPIIKEFHPDARVVPIEDLNREKVAYLVLVD
jgi:4-amino-4-deoxy-L-arabinose transferase-like glycosyltransferase